MLHLNVGPLSVVIDATEFALYVLALALLILAVTQRRRRTPLLIATVVLVALPWILPRLINHDSYYPRVLAMVQAAPEPQRSRLLADWASSTYPASGFATGASLHWYLWNAGHCTNLIPWYPGCRELPDGTEAEGIAKDELHKLSGAYFRW